MAQASGVTPNPAITACFHDRLIKSHTDDITRHPGCKVPNTMTFSGTQNDAEDDITPAEKAPSLLGPEILRSL